MAERGASAVVRIARAPGQVWITHCSDDGQLRDLLFRRDGDDALYGSVQLARLARTGGRSTAATATLHDGRAVWVDPAPARCAVTGRPATDGALVALRIVEEARPDKLPRASGRIELRGRRLALIAGETGTRLSHRIATPDARKALSDRLARLPRGEGAWLATRWAVDDGAQRLPAEAETLSGMLGEIRAKAAMAGAPRELLPSLGPIEECLLERVPAGPLRVVASMAALKASAEAVLARAGLAETASVTLDLGLAGPWFDPALAGQVQDALGATVAFPGGRLHVEPTQALTAVDVDGDPEIGFARVNRRAADMVMRQLRLREVGGIVVVDPAGAGTGQTTKAMIAELEKRAQTDPFTVKLSPGGAGLVTLVRDRRRPSLGERLGAPSRSPSGFVPSVETAALNALAHCVAGGGKGRAMAVRLELAADVAQYLCRTDRGRAALEEARRAIAMDIDLSVRQDFGVEDVELKVEGESGDG